jgi:hypothetical protein
MARRRSVQRPTHFGTPAVEDSGTCLPACDGARERGLALPTGALRPTAPRAILGSAGSHPIGGSPFGKREVLGS